MAGFNALAALMGRKPAPEVLGSGMAYQAARQVGSDDDYRRYVMDAQERGESPMPKEQWLRSQGR